MSTNISHLSSDELIKNPRSQLTVRRQQSAVGSSKPPAMTVTSRTAPLHCRHSSAEFTASAQHIRFLNIWTEPLRQLYNQILSHKQTRDNWGAQNTRHSEQDCTRWRTQTSPRRSLLSEYHTVSRYTCTCNLVYTHNKNTAFPAAIFRKLTNAQQR